MGVARTLGWGGVKLNLLEFTCLLSSSIVSKHGVENIQLARHSLVPKKFPNRSSLMARKRCFEFGFCK